MRALPACVQADQAFKCLRTASSSSLCLASTTSIQLPYKWPVGVLISGSRHAAAPQLWGTSPTPEHALIQRWLTNTARHCKTGQNYKLCHHSCAQLCTFCWKASVDCFERHRWAFWKWLWPRQGRLHQLTPSPPCHVTTFERIKLHPRHSCQGGTTTLAFAAALAVAPWLCKAASLSLSLSSSAASGSLTNDSGRRPRRPLRRPGWPGSSASQDVPLCQKLSRARKTAALRRKDLPPEQQSARGFHQRLACACLHL